MSWDNNPFHAEPRVWSCPTVLKDSFQSDDVSQESAATSTDIESLEERIASLERRLQSSQLFSDRFLLRAWAVFRHFVVGHLLLTLPFAIIFLIVSGLAALFSFR